MTLYYVLVTGGWIYFEGYSSLIGWLIAIFMWSLPAMLRSRAKGDFAEAFVDSSGDTGAFDLDFGSSGFDAGGCDAGGDCGGCDGGSD